jgi:hypothetical protein
MTNAGFVNHTNRQIVTIRVSQIHLNLFNNTKTKNPKKTIKWNASETANLQTSHSSHFTPKKKEQVWPM